MPRKNRVISSTGIYHVMLRGINQQRIFEDEGDYQFFLDKLTAIKLESDLAVFSYALMSNHVHLLLQEGEVKLSEIIKRLAISYAYYFNKRYERSGHLFHNRFKSEPVEDEAYLVTVINYIHQNPVRAGICQSAGKYRWSSLHMLGKTGSLVDEDMLFTLVPAKEVLTSERQVSDIEPFSVSARGRRPRYSEERAVSLMQALCGAKTTSQFQNMDRAEQERAVRELAREGVSIRQIARISGVNKGLVEQWARQQEG